MDLKKQNEKRFHQTHLEKLKRDWAVLSRENKMSKRRLMEYYGLSEIENTEFGTRFFNWVKRPISKRKGADNFLDYDKFIRTTSILTKGSEEERLKFIYTLFDIDGDGFIEREEMIKFLTIFYDAMKMINFDSLREVS